MIKFSANLNFLFNEVPFMERFAAAAKAGFKYVEFMFPYDYDLNELKAQLSENQLELVLFNLPAGDWDGGDRGLAVDPARKSEFQSGIAKAIEAAKFLGVPRVNCLVGKAAGNYSDEQVRTNFLENIGLVADKFKQAGLDLMIEPINHLDMPGFYLNTTTQYMELIPGLNRSNIYLQYDIYHAEREEEDHEMILREYFPQIGHVQVADNPGRNQPGTGVVNVKGLLDALDSKGYQGYVGLEYRPSGSTVDSLSWVKEYGYSL